VSEDLFTSAAKTKLQSKSPLAERMRPKKLDDVIGQSHLLGPDGSLRKLIEKDKLNSAILWGPAGTGKTTIARLLARTSSKYFEMLSAVNASVKDVRRVIQESEQRLGTTDQGTILFLDEVHRFSKSQQDALLPAVENGLITLIGATTENPFFEVNKPLRSRSALFRLNELTQEEVCTIIQKGLDFENATATTEAIEYLADKACGDARQALTTLEVAIVLAETPEQETTKVELVNAESATDLKSLRYGTDEHYDTISAFIKSIRGSDPHAGLYWLARMLEAGEDARFIARRLVILASEDVGMADPMSLLIANAAAHAVEFVGLPEAQINLAQAVTHLATAPKSNSSYKGLLEAQIDIRESPIGVVPKHLRDAHYSGAQSLGHGEGYKYPHNYQNAEVEQQYLPDELAEKIYYKPTNQGYEAQFFTG